LPSVSLICIPDGGHFPVPSIIGSAGAAAPIVQPWLGADGKAAVFTAVVIVLDVGALIYFGDRDM
jgi:hypothetical protein